MFARFAKQNKTGTPTRREVAALGPTGTPFHVGVRLEGSSEKYQKLIHLLGASLLSSEPCLLLYFGRQHCCVSTLVFTTSVQLRGITRKNLFFSQDSRFPSQTQRFLRGRERR